jgi:signal transduction histidine kinase
MRTLSYATSLLVFTGALFMLAAIVLGEKTRVHIPDELRRRWRLMISLMYFFLAGYLVFVAILVNRPTVPIELVAGPVFLGGAFFVFIVINLARKAIGRLKAAEENLRSLNESLEQRVADRTRDLAESNEELKSFLYSISHDLRAPLVNIKGFSEELGRSLREIVPCFDRQLPLLAEADKERIAPILKKDIPEALNFIGSSVHRMDNLINAVLKLSWAGRRKLNPERIRVSEMIRTILNSLAHQMEARHARVSAGELPDVVADGTALEQIFGNLLDNAVKYLEPGRTGEIEISAEADKEEVVFHVRDNGRGMAQEDIPRAFEIFRRVGRQDVPGEGIGLAQVRTLVRLHGGRIWCESQLGVGTTFSFTIARQYARNEEKHG